MPTQKKINGPWFGLMDAAIEALPTLEWTLLLVSIGVEILY